ncbi:coagulation factor IXa [Diretmus argenteus]
MSRLKAAVDREDVEEREFEVVDSFCYLGDMLNADGGVDVAVTARLHPRDSFIPRTASSQGQLHPTYSFIPGTASSQGQLHPRDSFIPGTASSQGQPHPRDSFIPGTASSQGQLHPRYSFIPGTASSQLHPRDSLIPGTASSQGQLHPRDSYIPGTASSQGQLHPRGSFIPGTASSQGQLHPTYSFIPGTASSQGQFHPRDSFIPGTLHPRDSFISGTASSQGHLHPRDSLIPGTATSQGQPHPRDSYIPGTASSQVQLHPRDSYIPAPNSGQVFLSGQAADSVLRRQKRHNTGIFEEFLEGNLERECIEEKCDLEEAREAFENDKMTMEFWVGYVDGDQCKPKPCQNQGTCLDLLGSYTCLCRPEFVGQNCEIVTARRCDLNNGDCMHFCESLDTFGAKCSCAEGYKLADDGVDCEPEEERHEDVKRIVGGELVIPGEIPWQVALIAHPSSQLFCGGSIITELWVLTAAHCLVEGQGSFFIRVGEHSIHTKEGTEQDHEVLEQHIHPRYNASVSMYNHDIALLRLQRPIDFSTTARPICLGPKAFTEALVKEASPATVSGWGRIRFQGTTADTLQKVEVPFTQRTECKGSSSARITRYMFCAGYYDEAKDSCQGDSGGPHANRYHDTWFLTGIVSWGEECAKEGKYGVYTRVSHYYRWIHHVMGATKNRLAVNLDEPDP